MIKNAITYKIRQGIPDLATHADVAIVTGELARLLPGLVAALGGDSAAL